MMNHRPFLMRRRSRRGANAVEFGLVMPVLFALLLGIFDYSWYFFEQSQMRYAVGVGARYGAVTPADGAPAADAIAKIRTELNNVGMDGNGATVTCPLTDILDELYVVCNASATFNPLVGYVPLPANTSSSLTMRFEDQ